MNVHYTLYLASVLFICQAKVIKLTKRLHTPHYNKKICSGKQYDPTREEPLIAESPLLHLLRNPYFIGGRPSFAGSYLHELGKAESNFNPITYIETAYVLAYPLKLPYTNGPPIYAPTKFSNTLLNNPKSDKVHVESEYSPINDHELVSIPITFHETKDIKNELHKPDDHQASDLNSQADVEEDFFRNNNIRENESLSEGHGHLQETEISDFDKSVILPVSGEHSASYETLQPKAVSEEKSASQESSHGTLSNEAAVSWKVIPLSKVNSALHKNKHTITSEEQNVTLQKGPFSADNSASLKHLYGILSEEGFITSQKSGEHEGNVSKISREGESASTLETKVYQKHIAHLNSNEHLDAFLSDDKEFTVQEKPFSQERSSSNGNIHGISSDMKTDIMLGSTAHVENNGPQKNRPEIFREGELVTLQDSADHEANYASQEQRREKISEEKAATLEEKMVHNENSASHEYIRDLSSERQTAPLQESTIYDDNIPLRVNSLEISSRDETVTLQESEAPEKKNVLQKPISEISSEDEAVNLQEKSDHKGASREYIYEISSTRETEPVKEITASIENNHPQVNKQKMTNEGKTATLQESAEDNNASQEQRREISNKDEASILQEKSVHKENSASHEYIGKLTSNSETATLPESASHLENKLLQVNGQVISSDGEAVNLEESEVTEENLASPEQRREISSRNETATLQESEAPEEKNVPQKPISEISSEEETIVLQEKPVYRDGVSYVYKHELSSERGTPILQESASHKENSDSLEYIPEISSERDTFILQENTAHKENNAPQVNKDAISSEKGTHILQENVAYKDDNNLHENRQDISSEGEIVTLHEEQNALQDNSHEVSSKGEMTLLEENPIFVANKSSHEKRYEISNEGRITTLEELAIHKKNSGSHENTKRIGSYEQSITLQEKEVPKESSTEQHQTDIKRGTIVKIYHYSGSNLTRGKIYHFSDYVLNNGTIYHIQGDGVNGKMYIHENGKFNLNNSRPEIGLGNVAKEENKLMGDGTINIGYQYDLGVTQRSQSSETETTKNLYADGKADEKEENREQESIAIHDVTSKYSSKEHLQNTFEKQGIHEAADVDVASGTGNGINIIKDMSIPEVDEIYDAASRIGIDSSSDTIISDISDQPSIAEGADYDRSSSIEKKTTVNGGTGIGNRAGISGVSDSGENDQRGGARISSISGINQSVSLKNGIKTDSGYYKVGESVNSHSSTSFGEAEGIHEGSNIKLGSVHNKKVVGLSGSSSVVGATRISSGAHFEKHAGNGNVIGTHDAVLNGATNGIHRHASIHRNGSSAGKGSLLSGIARSETIESSNGEVGIVKGIDEGRATAFNSDAKQSAEVEGIVRDDIIKPIGIGEAAGNQGSLVIRKVDVGEGVGINDTAGWRTAVKGGLHKHNGIHRHYGIGVRTGVVFTRGALKETEGRSENEQSSEEAAEISKYHVIPARIPYRNSEDN